MIFANTVALVLALAPYTLFAAPTKTSDSFAAIIAKRGLPPKALQALEDGNCDLSKAQMPIAPTALPSPASGLRLAHVAVGRGTQNYTCKTTPNSPSSTPIAVGAIASLFNATCNAVRAPAVLADVTKLALDQPVPTSEIAEHLLSGHHEFTAAGNPLFLLNAAPNNYGWIQAKKNGTSNAPANAAPGSNGLGSVAWLKLVATDGTFKEVYRLNTAGGQAPKTCSGIQGDFTIEYAAEYWFWQ